MIRAISPAREIISPPPRKRARKRAPFKKVDVRRAIDAVKAGGLSVAKVEIKPDGSILLSSLEAVTAAGTDTFAEWEGRL